jgi:serine/threonine protein kinase
LPEEQKPTFGKYEVHEILGEGGMGRVWRGFDPDLEVPVAIKELKEQFRDTNNLERFYREAQIAAKCRHQNIVLITDLSKSPPYFVMEFLEAQELSVYVHKGKPLTLDRMVNVLGQVCDGLGFLHKRGIFHRDLKPPNVMLLADDVVKIADFGISKAPFGQKTMTQVIMGTIPYMSPEQITTPSSVDSRVDIWALGVILFELTQRKHPFPGEGDINTIFHIVHSEHAPFGDMPPSLAEPLKALITRALKKSPEERIASTKEFKALLRDLLKHADDPATIVFPHQPPTDSTVVLSAADIPMAIDPELVEKAKALVAEIESIPKEIQAVIKEPAYEKAAERAKMTRQLLEEGDLGRIESAIHGLESQKAAIQQEIQAGFDRLLSRAETALAKGRESEAAKHFRQVGEGDPSRTEAKEGFDRALLGLMNRGRRHQSQGNPTAAVKVWRELLELEPSHEDAARLIQEVEDEKTVREEADRALDQARKALEKGRPEEVEIALRPLLEREPEHPEALGLQARAREMLEEATRTLHADALRTEGRQFLGRQDFSQAKISFSTLLELVPGDTESQEALKTIEAAEEQERRAAGGHKIAEEAEAALQGADFSRAVGLFEEALEALPGDREIQNRLQAAQRRLEALLGAEKTAEARENESDLPAAVQIWEQVLKLQPSHPRASNEIARLTGLIERADRQKRGEEEAKRQAAEKKRKEEEAKRLAAEKKRKEEEAARHRAAEEAWREVAGLVSSIREIPAEDHPLLGGDLARTAVGAAGKAEAAHEKADAEEIRAQAKGLRKALEKIQARRKEVLAEKAAGIESAAAGLEEVLRPAASQLKEAAVRSAREAVARAKKDAGGPNLHPLDGHVTALKRARESILKEIQAALKAARETVRLAREALESAATKNRRVVDRRPDLKKKIGALKKEAAAAGSVQSLEKLGSLAKNLEAARAQVPTDPRRFLPHMLAAAGVVVAAASFLVWQQIQAGMRHDYLVQVVPWGRIVSIQSDSGEEVSPPAGESPFHRLALIPGTYTITLENVATGETESLTATIPDDAGGTVRLEGLDYKEGIRQLMNRDPYFEEAP